MSSKETIDVVLAAKALLERDLRLGLVKEDELRFTIGARKKAARELAGQGRSVRQIADLTGVSKTQIARDLKDDCPKTGQELSQKGTPASQRVPSKPKANGVSPHTKQAINEFHREAVDFFEAFELRFRQWQEDHPLLDEGGKDCLLQAFHVCAEGFADLVRLIEGAKETKHACSNI